jgi:hypothetical protein
MKLSFLLFLYTQNSIYSYSFKSKNVLYHDLNLRFALKSVHKSVEVFESLWKDDIIATSTVKHSYFSESEKGLESDINSSKKIRGLVASVTIPSNKEFISLPVDNCFIACSNNNYIPPSLPPDLLNTYSKLKRGVDRLSFLLIAEYLNKVTSKNNFKQSYIKILPQHDSFSSHTPIHWSQEKLSLFPYKKLRGSVESQRNRLDSLFSSLAPSFNGSLTIDLLLWATEVVGSRAFRGSDSPFSSTPLPLLSSSSFSVGFLVVTLFLFQAQKIDEFIAVFIILKLFLKCESFPLYKYYLLSYTGTVDVEILH